MISENLTVTKRNNRYEVSDSLGIIMAVGETPEQAIVKGTNRVAKNRDKKLFKNLFKETK